MERIKIIRDWFVFICIKYTSKPIGNGSCGEIIIATSPISFWAWALQRLCKKILLQRLAKDLNLACTKYDIEGYQSTSNWWYRLLNLHHIGIGANSYPIKLLKECLFQLLGESIPRTIFGSSNEQNQLFDLSDDCARMESSLKEIRDYLDRMKKHANKVWRISWGGC